jgi:hypothetical protein
MWCKSVGFVRWLAPLLILRSVGFLFYVLSVCSFFAGCLVGLQLTFGGLVKGGVLESFTFIGVEWPTLHQPAVSGRAVFLLPPLYPAA